MKTDTGKRTSFLYSPTVRAFQRATSILGIVVLLLGTVSNASAAESYEPLSKKLLLTGISVVALSIPLSVNTTSIVTEERYSTGWHWAGYIFGTLSSLVGVTGLADGVQRQSPALIGFGAGFLTFGLAHITTAVLASEIPGTRRAQGITPFYATSESSESTMGLSWTGTFD